MKSRIILACALTAAFIGGALFQGYVKPRLTDALASGTPAITEAASPAATEAAPASQQAPAYREYPRTSEAYRPVRHRRHRTWERQALIVGGSAGAGAGIGALAGGGKGAAIGAASGGLAGLIYNLATRH